MLPNNLTAASPDPSQRRHCDLYPTRPPPDPADTVNSFNRHMAPVPKFEPLSYPVTPDAFRRLCEWIRSLFAVPYSPDGALALRHFHLLALAIGDIALVEHLAPLLPQVPAHRTLAALLLQHHTADRSYQRAHLSAIPDGIARTVVSLFESGGPPRPILTDFILSLLTPSLELRGRRLRSRRAFSFSRTRL
jgi:hypothetical protein